MKMWAALFGLALALPGGVWYQLGVLQPDMLNVPEVRQPFTGLKYRLDPARSRFIVHAHRGGLAWFKGHDHLIGVKDFSGEVELSPDALNPASLQMNIRAASLEETSAAFTPQQKAIIKKELEEIVLETATFPEITFRSTDVKGDLRDGGFDVKIGGDITLHGVTKHITIPARVTIERNDMHAYGKFDLSRGDFKVKATSAFHGMVRVRGSLSFTFDIIGTQI